MEIPGLPADLGSIADPATTAVQAVTESATGAVDGVTTATEAVTGDVAGVTETAATAVDSAPQALTDLTGGFTNGGPEK
jgi:hypothetical protein